MFKIDEATGNTIPADLPPLVGTEKQRAWATDIRNSRARYLANDFDLRFVNLRNAGKITSDKRDEMLAKWCDLHRAELSNTSAAYWIEHRGGK